MSERLQNEEEEEEEKRWIFESPKERQEISEEFQVNNIAKVQSDPQPSVLWDSEAVADYASKLRRGQTQLDAGKRASNGMYQPLNQSDDTEIRVLEIKPGGLEDNLVSSLHHCSVGFEYQPIYDLPGSASSNLQTLRLTRHAVSVTEAKPVFYTALSYTWGPLVFDRPILCNGQTSYITAPLDAALRQLRDDKYPTMLWVDQLCINQKDNFERARQVPLMGKIYRHALSTIIWLGEDSDHGALDLMLHVYETLTGIVRDNLPASVFEGLPFKFDLAHAWRAIQLFFSRFYFERTWIIQEVVLSHNAIIKCALTEMLWEDFTSMCLVVQTSGFYDWLGQKVEGNDYTLASGCGIVGELSSLKSRFDGLQGALLLSESLVFCRHAKASDLRDKIYGTLGICRTELRPDYNQDLSDLYRKTTVVCLGERGLGSGSVPSALTRNDVFYHGIYSILICVDHDPRTEKFPNKPSWVPDWSQARNTTALGFSTSAANIYSAGNWYEESCFTISEDQRKLSLKGRVFDKIAKLTNVCTSPHIPEHLNVPDEINNYVSFVKDNFKYPNDMEATEAFYRTAVAGKREDGLQPCPPEYFDIFSSVFASDHNKQREIQHRSKLTLKPKKGKSARNEESHAIKMADRAAKKLEKLKGVRRAYGKAMKNRRLCATEQGYIGLVPSFAEVSDTVCVFAGGLVPFVVREVEVGKFILVGECYIQGLMNNEILGFSDTTRVFDII